MSILGERSPTNSTIAAIPDPRKAAWWENVGWPQIKAKAWYTSSYVQPALMTSKSQGHSPFQPWVSQPFTDSLYSLSRMPSKLVLNWGLQYRRQMEFQGSKTHREMVLPSPTKMTQEPMDTPRSQHCTKGRGPTWPKVVKAKLPGPPQLNELLGHLQCFTMRT